MRSLTLKNTSGGVIAHSHGRVVPRVVHRVTSSQVIQAGNGEEALEIYWQHPGQIALVVIDLGMPGMGGHKCLKVLLAINLKARLGIASGYTTDGQEQQALTEGSKAFVASRS